MKKVFFAAVFAAFALTSCGNDDDGGQTCTTCNSGGQSVEICQGDNGNAFVGGTDTTINYNTYVDALQISGGCN